MVTVFPIGRVRTERQAAIDDHWGGVISTIEIDPAQIEAEGVLGLSQFSHIEVVYHFHLVPEASVLRNAEHPRERKDWPRVGILAQRKKNRPNRLGVSVCRLLSVDGLTLKVEGLDAINGTPVLDIKPVIKEFAPRGEVTQPSWATELMREYY